MDNKQIKIIVAVVLLAIAGVIAYLTLGGGKSPGDRPSPASPDELTSPEQQPAPSREALDVDPG